MSQMATIFHIKGYPPDKIQNLDDLPSLTDNNHIKNVWQSMRQFQSLSHTHTSCSTLDLAPVPNVEIQLREENVL